MKMDFVSKSLESLHILVSQSIKALPEDAPGGVKINLEGLSVSLGKIRSLVKEKRPRRIGVFGPPKRGKSTLLNVFLGADILPSGTTPTTRCVVEIHNIVNGSGEPHIVTYDMDGYSNIEHNVDDVNEFKDALVRCFHRGSGVVKIEVYACFDKGTIPANSILLDTPGAEVAFEDDAHNTTMGPRGNELANDTKRALEILTDVDIPMFCMRADQTGSAVEKDFYIKYMQRIRPINIINFKDTCGDGEEYEVFDDAIEAYQLIRRDTLMVSSRVGMEEVSKGIDFKNSGFFRLQEMLQERLRVMQPFEGLSRAIVEYSSIISRLVSEKIPIVLPIIFIDNFVNSLNGFEKAEQFKIDIMKEKWYIALKNDRRWN